MCWWIGEERGFESLNALLITLCSNGWLPYVHRLYSPNQPDGPTILEQQCMGESSRSKDNFSTSV